MNETEYELYYDKFEELKCKGVYLIRNLDNNTLKIGITDNLPRRFKEINKSFKFCGTEPNLKIECFIKYENNLDLERFLHKTFLEYNSQNEWFNIEDITMVLKKLDDFIYIEPKKIEAVEKIDKIEQKDKIINSVDKYYLHSYYHYNKKDKNGNYEVNDIYIKATSKDRACSLIDKIYADIFHDWNYFGCEYIEELYTEINPSDYLIENFKKIETKAIIKLTNKCYTSLGNYLIKEYNTRLIERFNQIKTYIINTKIEVDDIFYDNCKLISQKNQLEEILEYIR